MKTSFVSLVGVVIIVFTACTPSPPENHLPALSEIPFYHNDHVVLDSEPDSDELMHLPQTAVTLRGYLQNPSDYEEQVLPVLISYGDLTFVQEIDENRIVIADQMQHQLSVLNTATMDTTTIAKQGNGPGDVSFMEDIGFLGDRMYVGMGTMKMSVFNTYEEVSYEETINIETSASSLAPTEKGVLIAGSPTFGPAKDSSKFEGLDAITLWSEQGEKRQSFGETYPLKGRFMLSRHFIDNNILRSIPGSNELFLSFRYFPLLYRYSSDGELLSTYQLDDFSTMVIEYGEEERSVSAPLDDFTEVTDLQFLDENYLLIYTKTFIKGEEGNENRDKEATPDHTKTRHQFYVLNVETDEYTFLGETTGDDTKFKITQNFILKIGSGDIIQIQR